MAINLLSDSFQNARTFENAKKALLWDLPTDLKGLYDLKMFTIEAKNSEADVLAVKTYLLILASKPDMDPLTELHQAGIRQHPELPYYTPEELVVRAQGLLRWDPESRRLQFVHSSALEYVMSYVSS